MILKLVIRNQLPRDSVILIKAPVEYVEIHQQKKTNISKITAPLLLKLGGSLDHMYTKAQNFLAPTLKQGGILSGSVAAPLTEIFTN